MGPVVIDTDCTSTSGTTTTNIDNDTINWQRFHEQATLYLRCDIRFGDWPSNIS